MAGLWGKLRGHGDFLSAGLDQRMRAFFVPWLDACLAGLREEWGAEWEERFDAMAPLAFWIGAGLTGGAGPIVGVMVASVDRIGRRYPLVLLGQGEAAPPMLMPTGFHEAAAGVLARLIEVGTLDAGDWPLSLGEAGPYRQLAGQDDPSLVWARNPSRPGASLMREITQFDHAAACAHRAHFWTAHHAAPGIALAGNGMPGMRALGWLIDASHGEDAGAIGAPIDGSDAAIRAASIRIPPADAVAHGRDAGGAAGQPSADIAHATLEGGGVAALRLGQELRINADADAGWAIHDDAAPDMAADRGRLVLQPDWSVAGGGWGRDLWQGDDDWAAEDPARPADDRSDAEAGGRSAHDRGGG